MPQFVLLSNADVGKLRFDNLRTELKKRELGRGRLIVELVARLKQAMVDKAPHQERLGIRGSKCCCICNKYLLDGVEAGGYIS